MTKVRGGLIAALSGLVLVFAAAPLAVAKDGDVIVRGTCTGSTTSKLKLSEENGRIEVEFEVDQNRKGVQWNVSIFRNGNRVARLTKVTRGPSGSLEVRALVANGAGTDTIRARATRVSGAVCTAVASWGR
jgi:hypothetical protein